jgi:ATP-binding cassette subfamily B protein
VFTGLNLHIESGQRVGLVGPSGSGKSTLFGLMQRFYDVQDGRISIHGQDISRVTQESVRAAISVVPQDISLLHRSVLENIRYGRPDASDAEVLEAATAARCDDFIEELPEGLDTIVAEALRGSAAANCDRARLSQGRVDSVAG